MTVTYYWSDICDVINQSRPYLTIVQCVLLYKKFPVCTFLWLIIKTFSERIVVSGIKYAILIHLSNIQQTFIEGHVFNGR